MFWNKHLALPKNALPWLVISGAPLLYWMMSLQIAGPAYLTDEIGYLANAAFLGGHIIDGASCYHAGYSFFLSPLFRFFSNPAYVWRGAMAVNAFLWFCSFVLLYRLLSDLLPESTVYDKTFALLCTALYPSWAIMSGYVYTNTCFTFMFMCSLYTLMRWKDGNALSLIPHSLCVGFLFWIHPTGGAVCGASFLAVTCICLPEKKYSVILMHAAFLLAMVLAYKLGIHRWLAVSMTPEGFQAVSRYRSVGSLFKMLQIKDYFMRFFLLIVGHVSGALISTLGIFASGIMSLMYLNTKIKITKNKILATPIFIILSFIFVVLLTIASFSFSKIRIDQLVYGRYLDPILFPILCFGVLYKINLKITIYNILIVLFFILLLIINKNTIVNYNCANQIVSFWPQYITNNYRAWFALGAIGMLLVFVLLKYSRYIFIFIILIMFTISSYKQLEWHNNILLYHSKPSSIFKLVQENFKYGSHVGFDVKSTEGKSLFHAERFNLYSFYLFNYNYKRMSQNEWLAKYEGPFFTFDIERLRDIPDVDVIAREKASGLYLVFKKQHSDIVIPGSIARAADIDLVPRDNREEFFSFCFDMKASNLAKSRQVGRLEGDRLVSDMREGFLFFGPYKNLDKGRYNIVLSGDFYETNGAVLDVVSNQGNTKHFSSALKYFIYKKSSEIIIPFILNNSVGDIEIRLYVTKKSNISINGYKILRK